MKKLLTSVPFCLASICSAAVARQEPDTLGSSKNKKSATPNTSSTSGAAPGTSSASNLRRAKLAPSAIDSLSPVTSSLTDVNDTSLVLASDVPMPVSEYSIFENAVYHKRLDSLQKEVPLNYNKYVQSYINLYAYKRRKLVERLLGEGSYYFPVFEKVLKESGLPAELKYLTIIESQLNPFAVSRVGATGLWQFMYGTGKGYGLQINSYIDERKDPLKASRAAAAYFKDSYLLYGDWLLVIASYNCGTGNVNKAIRRAGGGTRTFWEIQRYLPRETRSYVPAFIAATYIFNYSKHHGLCAAKAQFSTENDSVMVSARVGLNRVASSLNMDPSEVRRLNPQYKRGVVNATAEHPLELIIPTLKKEAFVAMRDRLQSTPEESNAYQAGYFESGIRAVGRLISRYRVRRGETLSQIADNHQVTVQDLKVWNHLRTLTVGAGQHLKIRLAGSHHGRVGARHFATSHRFKHLKRMASAKGKRHTRSRVA